MSEGPIFAYQQVRKPISIKLRREKKLKGVIMRKRHYNAKWKGVITPFMHKKGVITPFAFNNAKVERRNNALLKGEITVYVAFNMKGGGD